MSERNFQDVPDWLVNAVRGEHVTAQMDGRDRAGDDAVERLAARALADDPEFARAIVERYVRSLVRAPKPRRRTKDDKARDRLMAECARMDAEGMSRRAIGEAKGISRQTAANLVAEWRACSREMSPDLIRLATPGRQPEAAKEPAALPPQIDAPRPNLTLLRRPA